MTDQTRDEVSRYDRLSPRACWFLENFDELDLAESCASFEAALARVRKLIASDPCGIFSDDEINAALDEDDEPEAVAHDLTAALRERRHPIRQNPDELRGKAETDMLAVHPPAICELPHQTIAEEEECERERLAAIPDLTAEEARDLADDLGLQLYRAQDALAFVGECCDLADLKRQPITTRDVREWLKGARCGRQLAADTGLVVDPAAPPVHLVTWTGPADNAEQPARTTPANPATGSDTPDNGPSVAEAAADDRAWPLQREGE